ncbi:MAG: M23 family metallopeptidase [Xanthobacteraceae bacterium]
MYRHDPGFGHSDPSDRFPDPHVPPQGSRGRGGKVAALCTIVFLSAWSGVTTLYILFRDDALKLIAERQVAASHAYDAQAMQLQAEIERLRSLKLIDQERVDRAVAELVRRQTMLESRQSALIEFGDEKSIARDRAPEVTGSVPASRAAPAAQPHAKPTPLSDTILLAPPTERWSRLESRPLAPIGADVETSQAATATEVRVSNLARELEQLEVAQGRALNDLEERYDGREQRMRKVFAELGLKNARGSRFLAGKGEAATGGPFLPWSRPPQDPFTRQVYRIRAAARSVQALEQEIVTVPVRRPTSGETDVTSPFGVRLDPFVRQLAMHTGVDFRGEPGDPVRAAAAGKIVQAERNGGYGLIVEIDHGNGIATRYAHLSSLAVEAGGNVAAGALIGRVGSTGRSTGPHLHYEVRLNGDPVDPQKYLRAGLRLEAPN